MNFRARPDMYVCFPKQPLTAYVDNTMPKRDWSKFDEPTYLRRQRALNGEHTRVSIFHQRQAG